MTRFIFVNKCWFNCIDLVNNKLASTSMPRKVLQSNFAFRKFSEIHSSVNACVISAVATYIMGDYPCLPQAYNFIFITQSFTIQLDTGFSIFSHIFAFTFLSLFYFVTEFALHYKTIFAHFILSNFSIHFYLLLIVFVFFDRCILRSQCSFSLKDLLNRQSRMSDTITHFSIISLLWI